MKDALLLERELVAVGLSQKEAAVYAALLGMGVSSVHAISQRARVVRPTAYVVLEGLVRKGLAARASGPDAKKRLYCLESPDRLADLAEERRREADRRFREAERVIPELRSATMQEWSKTRVRVFRGREGLRQLQREFVTASREAIVGVTPIDELMRVFPEEEYDRTVLQLRVAARIPTRHLYAATSWRHSPERDAALLRESRFLAPELFPIRTAFAVHGTILSLVSFREEILGVLLDNAGFAQTFRAVFEVLWAVGGQPGKYTAAQTTPLTVSRAASTVPH